MCWLLKKYIFPSEGKTKIEMNVIPFSVSCFPILIKFRLYENISHKTADSYCFIYSEHILRDKLYFHAKKNWKSSLFLNSRLFFSFGLFSFGKAVSSPSTPFKDKIQNNIFKISFFICISLICSTFLYCNSLHCILFVYICISFIFLCIFAYLFISVENLFYSKRSALRSLSNILQANLLLAKQPIAQFVFIFVYAHCWC